MQQGQFRIQPFIFHVTPRRYKQTGPTFPDHFEQSTQKTKELEFPWRHVFVPGVRSCSGRCAGNLFLRTNQLQEMR